MGVAAAGSDFVGRAAELRLLRGRLAEAMAGRGGLVLVSGEPGIGKTRLVEEATAGLPPARVLWGRCRDTDGAPAYWPWTQALRALVDTGAASLGTPAGDITTELARVAPDLRRMFPEARPDVDQNDDSARFRLFDAVGELLGRLCSDQPLVIVLDDLHWADTESLLLLRFLGSEIAHIALLVVGTFRDVEMRQSSAVPRILGDLARVSQRVALRGLAEEEVAAFVAAARREVPAGAVSFVHRVTDGNPFFVGEILALLERDGWDPAAFRVPHEVHGAIRCRLDPLPEVTRRVLEIGSVLGREFDLARLAHTVDQSQAAVVAALGPAISTRLLVEVPAVPGRFRFSHALVQDTLYQGIPVAERAHLHRRIGEHLESLAAVDAAAGEIAHHLFHALDRPALAKAVAWAARAAEHAMATLGYEEAAGHYERGLSVLRTIGGDPGERLRLLLAFGDAQACAGDVDGFRGTFLEAARLARECDDGESFARAALGYGLIPSMQKADPVQVELLEQALFALGRRESSLRARVLANLAMARYYVASAEQRAVLTGEAVAMARRLADPLALSVVLRAHYYSLVDNQVEERLQVALESVRVAESVGQHALACEARINVVFIHLERGDVAVADQELARVSEIAAMLRLPHHRWRAKVVQAVRAQLAGDMATAEALAEQAVVLAPMGVHERDARGFLAGILFHVRRAQDRLGELDPLLSDLAEDPGGPMWASLLALSQAETGRTEAATFRFRRVCAHGFEDLRRDWSRVPTLAFLADTCAHIGATDTAPILHRLLEAEACLVIMSPAGCLGAAARYLGMLKLVMGEADEAIAQLERALATNQRIDAQLEIVRTRIGLARALIVRNAAGDRERAHAILAAAEGAARRMDFARALVELGRFQEELAAVPPPRPTARPAHLRRAGAEWLVGCGAESVRLPDTKGVTYLRSLLASPGREIHVVDLARAQAPPRSSKSARSGEPSAGERERLRERLAGLREELEEAVEFNDLGRAAVLREEMELLAEQLSGSLGGESSDEAAATKEVERMRLNVTRAMHAVLRRIAAGCPALGHHLTRSVRTGLLCCYLDDPAFPVVWEL